MKGAVPLPCSSSFFLTVATAWNAGFSVVDFVSPDAYDYAQMGREIRSGYGFSTRQLLPRHIPYLFERGYLRTGHPPNL